MRTPGKRIREEREAKEWSQQRLADEISRIKKQKISRAAVAQWENGESKTQKPENLFAAANALGLLPQWVLDETGEKYALRANTVTHSIASEPAPAASYESTLPTIKPASEKDAAIANLIKIASQLDLLRIGQLIERATTLQAEMPAKQTHKSSQ